MSDPNDLAAFLGQCWQHLGRGVADAKSPARYPTLATVSPDGRPELRTVALRRADVADAVLEVHTDIATPKVAAIKSNPWASFHVWVPRSDLQIRAVGNVDIITGPEVDADWERVPLASRVSYGTEPVPGAPIGHAFDYQKPATRDRFAVLRCHLQQLDLVHLGEQHRRAVFVRADGWAGQWVAP